LSDGKAASLPPYQEKRAHHALDREPEERQTATPETGPKKQPTSRWISELQPPQLDEDLPRKAVERLQEIFMTSRPLDGIRVAALVQELPGIETAEALYLIYGNRQCH
jgi:hypothetical protein